MSTDDGPHRARKQERDAAVTEFTQREQAILSIVEELRDSGQQEQLDELLASLENGEMELIEDGSIDSLWADVVRSRKITTDMLTTGQAMMYQRYKEETG